MSPVRDSVLLSEISSVWDMSSESEIQFYWAISLQCEICHRLEIQFYWAISLQCEICYQSQRFSFTELNLFSVRYVIGVRDSVLLSEISSVFHLFKSKQRNTAKLAMTSASDQWVCTVWLVNLNSGLRPNLGRLVSVVGLRERLIQQVSEVTHCVVLVVMSEM